MNDTAEIEEAFSQIRRALRPRGTLVLGWDDNPPRRPLYPEQIVALRGFAKLIVDLYGGWRHVTDTPYRKVYDFYTAIGLRTDDQP